jgi:acetyl-CoA synthetase
MKTAPKHLQRHNVDSLRLLGSVGEPINPEAWQWYFKNVGQENCPIVDTYWQTETGAIMITPLPGATPMKPGAATWPFFGIQPALLDAEGKEIEGPGSGHLCIKAPWPSMARGIYGEKERFFQTYFSQYPGYYFTGDGATRDADGYYWITGRVDDVMNVSGHRLGTAEIEGAILEHPSIAEAAVVPFPHEIKGQGVYAYISVKEGVQTNDLLKQEIIERVMHKIGKIARLDVIHWAPGLPKTRSGKILRRILRKIAEGEFKNLGDTSVLVDDSLLKVLMEDKAKYH